MQCIKSSGRTYWAPIPLLLLASSESKRTASTMKFFVAVVAVLASVNFAAGHFHHKQFAEPCAAPVCAAPVYAAPAPCIVEKPYSFPVKIKSPPCIVEKPIPVKVPVLSHPIIVEKPIPFPVPVKVAAPCAQAPCAPAPCAPQFEVIKSPPPIRVYPSALCASAPTCC